MKRDIFSELTEGFSALEEQRLGKITLRTVTIDEPQTTPIFTAQDVVNMRERLNLSRNVFAYYLRINPRTLENWEQGRAKPNAQAAVLLALVGRFPDTVERLREI